MLCYGYESCVFWEMFSLYDCKVCIYSSICGLKSGYSFLNSWFYVEFMSNFRLFCSSQLSHWKVMEVLPMCMIRIKLLMLLWGKMSIVSVSRASLFCFNGAPMILLRPKLWLSGGGIPLTLFSFFLGKWQWHHWILAQLCWEITPWDSA